MSITENNIINIWGESEETTDYTPTTGFIPGKLIKAIGVNASLRNASIGTFAFFKILQEETVAGGKCVKTATDPDFNITYLTTKEQLLNVEKAKLQTAIDNYIYNTKVKEAEKLSTARKIGGVNFDGSSNINLPGVNLSGNQNTSGSAAGTEAKMKNIVGGNATGIGTDAANKFNSLIQVRSDTAANWSTQNPILFKGEFGYDETAKAFKIGDDTTNWNNLPYAGRQPIHHIVFGKNFRYPEGIENKIFFDKTFTVSRNPEFPIAGTKNPLTLSAEIDFGEYVLNEDKSNYSFELNLGFTGSSYQSDCYGPIHFYVTGLQATGNREVSSIRILIATYQIDDGAVQNIAIKNTSLDPSKNSLLYIDTTAYNDKKIGTYGNVSTPGGVLTGELAVNVHFNRVYESSSDVGISTTFRQLIHNKSVLKIVVQFEPLNGSSSTINWNTSDKMTFEQTNYLADPTSTYQYRSGFTERYIEYYDYTLPNGSMDIALNTGSSITTISQLAQAIYDAGYTDHDKVVTPATSKFTLSDSGIFAKYENNVYKLYTYTATWSTTDLEVKYTDTEFTKDTIINDFVN